VKPDRRDDFLGLIEKNQKLTLMEPECLQYVVGEDVSSPNTFYLHEQFTSEEGLEEHRNMPHASDWAVFKGSEPFEKGIELFDSYTLAHDTEKLSPSKSFGVQVVLCVKSDKVDSFLECIQQNRAGSVQEPACIQYTYGESKTDSNRFIFHEEYLDEDGFEAHKSAPHFAVWEEFASTDPFTEEPIVNLFESVVFT